MMAKSIPEYNTESEEDYQINNGNETSTTKRRTKRSRSWKQQWNLSNQNKYRATISIIKLQMAKKLTTDVIKLNEDANNVHLVYTSFSTILMKK